MVVLGLSNGESGRVSRRFGISSQSWSLGSLPEDPDVSTEGLQEGGDVDLLQGLFAVIHGHEHVLRADAVGLLQAAVHTWRTSGASQGLKTCFSFVFD